MSIYNVSEKYINGKYLENNKTWHVEDSKWKSEKIYKILLENNIIPKTLCEVGCGAGEILNQLSLKLNETDFFGYEISPQAFELCKTRQSEKLSFFQQNLLDDNYRIFDCLLCIDVFEHVENYMGFIKSLKSKSKYKIFHIPIEINLISILRGTLLKARNDVGHLHYFTPETAIATLEDCGYRILDRCYTNYFIDYGSNKLMGKIAKFMLKYPYAFWPDLMVKLMGGCSLLVVAE